MPEATATDTTSTEATSSESTETTEAATTSTATTATETDELGEAGKKALDAERTARRAAEKTARDAQKELDKLRQESMTADEKALDDARKSARSETLLEVGSKRVVELVRAKAGDRVADVDALLEYLDASKFLDDDLEPDVDKIDKWLESAAPPKSDTEETTTSTTNPFLDLGQGSRSGGDSTALGGDPLLKSVRSKLGITG